MKRVCKTSQKSEKKQNTYLALMSDSNGGCSTSRQSQTPTTVMNGKEGNKEMAVTGHKQRSQGLTGEREKRKVVCDTRSASGKKLLSI